MSKNSEVIERRLKPLYHNLDMGFHKKTIQEADKLLKKQPDFLAAKPLKALALIRLGRNEEAEAILNDLEKLEIEDEYLMQAMTTCFKELHQPLRILKMYEVATKVQPQNIDLLSKFFMSAVRVHDFKLQQRIALQMHKLNSKNPYYFWAVMSIFMQGMTNRETGRKLSFPLAEKMVSKFVQEGRIEADAEVKLLLLIYQESGGYEAMLSFLDQCERSDVCGKSWLPAHQISQKKGYCLFNLGRWNDLFDWAVGVFDNGTTGFGYDWQTFTYFIASAEKLPDRREEAFAQIDGLKKLLSSDRGVGLASVAISIKLGRSEAEVLASLSVVLHNFGKKSCCFNDLAPFLADCSYNVRDRFTSEVLPDWKTFKGRKLGDNLGDGYHMLNIARLHFLLRKDWTEATYVDFAKTMLRFSIEAPTKCDEEEGAVEYQFMVDSFVVLAVDVLLTAQRLLKPFERFSLVQELLVIIQHFLGTPKRPMNFYLVIVAIKLYAVIGCASKMTALIETLETKYTQREALAHFYFDYLLPWGLIENNGKFADIILHTGDQAQKEIAESLVTSYRQGQFNTAMELYQVSNRLTNSLMQAIGFVEYQFLNLITGDLHPSVVQLQQPPVILPVDDYVLNLDFQVLQSSSGASSEDCVKLYVDLLRSGLSLKQHLLAALRELVSLVATGKSSEKDCAKLSQAVTGVRAGFKNWQSFALNPNMGTVAVDAPVLPPHDIFVQGAYINLVCFWLNAASEFLVTGTFGSVHEDDGENGVGDNESLRNIVTRSPVELTLHLMFANHRMRETNGDMMEFPHEQLCHLSYAVWALAVGVFVQEILQPCTRKGKKKKNDQPTLRKCAESQLSALESVYNQLLDLQHFLYASSEPVSILDLEDVREWYPQFRQTRDTGYGLAIEQSLRVVVGLIARQKMLLK